MASIRVEYFGPAKKFTAGKEFDTIISTNNELSEIFANLLKIHGLKFVKYIFESCGIVINEDYIEVESRELINDATEITYSEVLKDILKKFKVKPNDVVVIIPPVSAG